RERVLEARGARRLEREHAHGALPEEVAQGADLEAAVAADPAFVEDPGGQVDEALHARRARFTGPGSRARPRVRLPSSAARAQAVGGACSACPPGGPHISGAWRGGPSRLRPP